MQLGQDPAITPSTTSPYPPAHKPIPPNVNFLFPSQIRQCHDHFLLWILLLPTTTTPGNKKVGRDCKPTGQGRIASVLRDSLTCRRCNIRIGGAKQQFAPSYSHLSLAACRGSSDTRYSHRLSAWRTCRSRQNRLIDTGVTARLAPGCRPVETVVAGGRVWHDHVSNRPRYAINPW